MQYDSINYSYSYFKTIELNTFIIENNYFHKGNDITKKVKIEIDSIFIENNFPLIEGERCVLCGKANLYKLTVSYLYNREKILTDTLGYTNQNIQQLLINLKDGFSHVYTKEDKYIGFEGNGNIIFHNKTLNTYFFRMF